VGLSARAGVYKLFFFKEKKFLRVDYLSSIQKVFKKKNKHVMHYLFLSFFLANITIKKLMVILFFTENFIFNSKINLKHYIYLNKLI
jgi:hypothetical protein